MSIHVRIIITDYIFMLQYDVKIQPPQIVGSSRNLTGQETQGNPPTGKELKERICLMLQRLRHFHIKEEINRAVDL